MREQAPHMPQHWWPQHLLLGWMNLVLIAPVIYLYVGLPLILRQHDWSGTQIGLLPPCSSSSWRHQLTAGS